MKTSDLDNLVEAVKKDQKMLKALKVLAVKCQQFSLAADIRDLEHELFPQTEEQKKAMLEGSNIGSLLRMIEINVPDRLAWIIYQAIKRYLKRRDNFDLKDAAELKAKMIALFGDDSD